MKLLIILATTILLTSLTTATAHAIELEQFPNRGISTLKDQSSPEDAIVIEEAYITYKYVAGMWLVVTFSVPDTDYNKEVFLVVNQYKTIKGKFVDNETGLNHSNGNIMWLGSDGERARFVMLVNSEFQVNATFELYVKSAGAQYANRFKVGGDR